MNDRQPLVRGAGLLAVLVAVLMVGARGQTTPDTSRLTWAAPSTAPRGSAGRPAPPASGGPQPEALPRSAPLRVSIPAIDAESALVPLRLNPDRTVEVPPVEDPMQAGWYALGPTPGEAGASVILGHVDGYTQPGIFFRLRDLRSGDQVLVARADGATARFVVYRTEQVPKDAFPTAEVYGGTSRPELHLVTCGGAFDRQAGSYLDNIIVFAVLAGSGSG
ncbi:class F sortase [Planosporangium thailandense]|uniref:Class F sortase n=1 Tax=Planosporangium thailandense TaxID=765197 RepID=A0ABX0XXE5_9ACTN|nr:class F sortase [Planosporangium thailandense]NJC70045.1 class F sortase [Planosporangium thailandense]